MTEFALMVPPLAAGLLLGAFFFGGLWWTVRRGISASQPALWFFASLFVRMSVTMAAFYAVSGDRWERWVFCLLGFMVGRLILKGWVGPKKEPPTHRAPGAPHAP